MRQDLSGRPAMLSRTRPAEKQKKKEKWTAPYHTYTGVSVHVVRVSGCLGGGLSVGYPYLCPHIGSECAVELLFCGLVCI